MTPIQVASVAFASGVFLGLVLKVEPIYLAPIIFGSLAVMFAPLPKAFPRYAGLFLALGIAIATINGFHQPSNLEGLDCSAKATVLSVMEQSKDRLIFDVKALEGQPEEMLGRVVRCYGKPDALLEVGDVVQITGVAHSASFATNPGQFDFKSYLDRQNVSSIVNLFTPPKVIEKSTNWLALLGPRIRQKAAETYSLALPQRYALMLDSLVFGRAELPKGMSESFQRTGTAHVLAASGFNVTVVAFAAMWLLLWIFGSRKGSIAGAIVITILYAAAAGFSPSVSRALVMAILSMGAMLLGRKYSAASGLSAAVLVLLAFRPTWLLEASFQLSFVASLVFFVASPHIQKMFEKAKWYKKPLVIVLQSLLIQLLTLPILAYHFHTFSLVSPVANVIAIPFAEALTPIGALAGAIGSFAPPVGIMLTWLVWPLLVLMDYLLSTLASPSWVQVAIGSLPLLVWLPYYLAIGAAYKLYAAPPKWDKTKLVLVGALVALVGFLAGTFTGLGAEQRDQVTFLDIGHGDAIFVRTSAGKTILIDAGGQSNLGNFDPGERIVLPFLRFMGVNSLDVVVATHMDQDHIGGLVMVLDQISARQVFKSNVASDTFKSQDLGEVLRQKGTAVAVPTAGQRIALDESSEILFYGPPGLPLGKGSGLTNNGSVVCKITLSGVSFLMTGDVGKEGMVFELEGKESLNSSVIKLSHHGEYNESLPEYLSVVSPEVAVNSDSAREGSGAHVKTDKLLQTLKVPMLSTARFGAITFWVNDGKYSVSTFLK